MLQVDRLRLWEPSTQLSLEPEGGLGLVARGMKSMCYPYTLLLNPRSVLWRKTFLNFKELWLELEAIFF